MEPSVTMKDLPKTERPYEKFEQYGADSLSDAELIAIILRTGTSHCNVIDLAVRILKAHKSYEGLNGLARLTINDLIQIPGIGRIKAIQLLSVIELSVRLSKIRIQDMMSLSDPESVAGCYMQEMRFLKQELVKVLFFDTKSHLLGECIVSSGTVNASMMSPREIYLAALNYNAVHIILLHNHPSGDPTPSKEDILATKRVKDAGSLIGIKLMDHIIIGDNRYISLKEQGILN